MQRFKLQNPTVPKNHIDIKAADKRLVVNAQWTLD